MDHRRLRWSIALGPVSRPTQGHCAGWWSLRRKDYTGEGTPHRSLSLEKRSCTCPRRKVGSAIPSQGVRGDAELVVGGSGCHRARNGDQDTLSETSGESLSWRDGTLTAHSKCEPSHGLRMAAIMHATFKSKWRDSRKWCPGPQGRC